MPNFEQPPNEIECLKHALQRLIAIKMKLDQEKQQLTVDLAEAREAHAKLQELLAAAHLDLDKAEEELEKLKHVPWLPAYIVRVFDEQKRYVEVGIGSGRNSVALALEKSALTEEPIDLTKLVPGQKAWIIQNGCGKDYLLVHVTPEPQFEELGEIRTFDSVQGDLIAVKQGEAKAFIRPAACFSAEGLKSGDSI